MTYSIYTMRTQCMLFSRQLQLQGLYLSHLDHMVSMYMLYYYVKVVAYIVNATIAYFTKYMFS